MVPVLQPLPLDWSGAAIGNRTNGEIHNLTPQYEWPYRIIVMEKGYFYTKGLHLMDNRGYVLKENQDYQCIAINKEVIKVTSSTAAAVILITNPSVGNIVLVDAQMVGGRFCNLNPAILDTAANVVFSKNRKVYWKNIKNKPDSLRPSGHLHALWELYGFTEQTDILKRMTTALDKKSAQAFIDLFDEYKNAMLNVERDKAAIEGQLTAHINDSNNPHILTKDQVGLSVVYNASIATEDEARLASGSLLNVYATPLRARQSIESNFYPALTAHVTNYNNPHADTAAKLGTMTNVEFSLALVNYYDKGSTVTRTNALMGYNYPQLINVTTRNIPIQNITSGILSQPQFATSWGPAGTVAVPGPNGVLTWRSIADIINQYGPKGNQVIWTNFTFGNTVNSAAEVYRITGQLASVIGTNFPENSIAVFRHEWWFVGKSGGYVNTIVHNLGMATMRGGQWVIPGWPRM